MEQKDYVIGKILIIGLILFIVGVVVIFLYVGISNSFEQYNEDLKICKELGYDGVNFIIPFSTQAECVNFTDLQKYKAELKQEASSS